MKRTLAAVTALTLFAAPALAETTIETATGPVTISETPATTAVLDMASLDMLDALGIEGVTATSNTYLERLAPYAGDLGTLFEPDYEALNALSPDLIVAGGRSTEAVPQLEKLAPTVDMTMWGDDLLDQTRARLAAFGALYGKEAEAAALTESLDAEIAATQAAVEGKGNALILMTNGGKVSAYGAGGRFGWIHTEIGLPEVIEGLEDTSHGESVSFEFIRETNPDWILVLDRVAAIGGEGESAEATLDNPLVAETTAAQKGQIVYLNAGDIYVAGGGITSVLNTLEIIQTAFGASS
ncbi:siderophore ABC transporter substrate-binding protein [Maritimibacter sp. DP1N21-5]|uniref:siderophore ABC transporter substrate-binding protein n=1 Tax=Maritimibacter sp. DP1N21-5 TaxID=2836867 RepID=UPI001C44C4B3|nr:siderophore ABC transporter substrate-binding protein [Maritimibacter sp. DP1N21-5]MBV7407827.1 siderophore ABC transporter substrate-binding protein [Maritimibacter sp. DP1N21-5]